MYFDLYLVHIYQYLMYLMSRKYRVPVLLLGPKYLIHIKYFSNTKIEHGSYSREGTHPSFYRDSCTDKPMCVITALLARHKFHSSQCKQIANN